MDVERDQQPAEADVLADHHPQLEDLRLREVVAQLIDERVVDPLVVVRHTLGN